MPWVKERFVVCYLFLQTLPRDWMSQRGSGVVFHGNLFRTFTATGTFGNCTCKSL